MSFPKKFTYTKTEVEMFTCDICKDSNVEADLMANCILCDAEICNKTSCTSYEPSVTVALCVNCADKEFAKIGITRSEAHFTFRQITKRPIPNPIDFYTPAVVCFCGSTKFYDPAYNNAQGLNPWEQAIHDFTLQGYICLSIGVNGKNPNCEPLTEAQKQQLDRLHRRKIDLAQQIHIINVNGYVGLSTKREIYYAESGLSNSNNKKMTWLEPDKAIPIETIYKELGLLVDFHRHNAI